MERDCDTLVIGGGVIGAATAYWLSGTGRAVTVLERRPELGRMTTPNALGTLRTQFGVRSLVALAQESLAFYRDVEQHLEVTPSELGWANNGYLYLTDDDEDIGRLAQALQHYEHLGVTSSELVRSPELERRFPFCGQAVAGIFHGDGSWVDPTKITPAWAGAARRQGASFETGTTGESLRRADRGSGRRWTVSTNRGVFAADEVVVCAGPLAHRFLLPFGVDLPLRITPRFRALVPEPEPDEDAAPLVINIRNGSYWRPAPGGTWLSTANVDDASVEPQDTVTAPVDFVQTCAAEIEPVSPRLAARARQAAATGTAAVSGGYQVYPADDIPFIGAVADWPGLFANYGHWAGIMLAPASARLLTELMDGIGDDRDNPCRLTRFDGANQEELLAAPSTNKFGGWG